MSREVCTTVDVGGEIEGHEVGGRRGRFEDRMSTHTVLVHVYSQPEQSYRNSGRFGVHIIMEVGGGGGGGGSVHGVAWVNIKSSHSQVIRETQNTIN